MIPGIDWTLPDNIKTQKNSLAGGGGGGGLISSCDQEAQSGVTAACSLKRSAAAGSWINGCDGSLNNRNGLICPVGLLCNVFQPRPIEVE